MMIKLKHTLLSCLLLCGIVSAHAEKTETPNPQIEQITNTSALEKRAVLKLSDEQFAELVADENYEPSHSNEAYSLYMTDISYGNSDQYIDGVVRFAMQSDYKQLVDVVHQKASLYLITKQQSDKFLKELKAVKNSKKFDTAFKANLIIEIDNHTALNVIAKNHPELKEQTENRPENFKKFDLNDYYAQKYSMYLRTVENRFQTYTSPYEQKEWQDRAYITPITSVYKIVSESHLKPKLRSLVAFQVRYGQPTEYEKALLMWWMDQLK